MDRNTPAGEAEFRTQQKREEVQQVLAEMPDTVDAFIASPKWTRNLKDNFVFRGHCPSVTIFINDRGINWCVPGGKASWGPGEFATIEDAKQDLWVFLKSGEKGGEKVSVEKRCQDQYCSARLLHGAGLGAGLATVVEV